MIFNKKKIRTFVEFNSISYFFRQFPHSSIVLQVRHLVQGQLIAVFDYVSCTITCSGTWQSQKGPWKDICVVSTSPFSMISPTSSFSLWFLDSRRCASLIPESDSWRLCWGQAIENGSVQVHFWCLKKPLECIKHSNTTQKKHPITISLPVLVPV